MSEALHFRQRALQAFEKVKAWLVFVPSLVLGLKDAQRLDRETQDMVKAMTELQKMPEPVPLEVEDALDQQV